MVVQALIASHVLIVEWRKIRGNDKKIKSKNEEKDNENDIVFFSTLQSVQDLL